MSGDVEISIDIDELRTRKVMVATPMYGGTCSGIYTKSISDLSIIATHNQLDFNFNFLFNESLITRARNYLCDEFLRSDYTHLMFIDSDIGFDATDVLALAALADPRSDMDIICGPYPKKCISWEKVKMAVDKGFGDKNPEHLSNFIGDYVFNPVGNQASFAINEPVEVLEGGTGFMMIQKRVFSDFIKAYPHMKYRPDHVRTEHFDGSREIYAFFDALIDDKNSNVYNEAKAFISHNPTATRDDLLEFIADRHSGVLQDRYSNRYLSEDYMFCQWVRKTGRKVWLCPWMRTIHVGTYPFAGSLAALAEVGVAATADPVALGKEDGIKKAIDKTPKRKYAKKKVEGTPT